MDKMSKGRKMWLQPGYLANGVIPDYERKRNETVKKNNELLNSLGLKAIATSLWGSDQHKHAKVNGKRSRIEFDDDNYSPSHDDEFEGDHDNYSDIDRSPPKQSKKMGKRRCRIVDMEANSQPSKSSINPQSGNKHSASQSSQSQPLLARNTSPPQPQPPQSLPIQPQPSQSQPIQPQPTQSHLIQSQPIQQQSAQQQPAQTCLIQSLPNEQQQPQPAQPQQEGNIDLNDNILDAIFDEIEVGIRDDANIRTKRGMTRLSDIWNLPPGKRLALDFNATCLPVGVEGGMFNRFIGTVARKPNLCPINCKSWHHVPMHYKEECWSIIESKFVIPDDEEVRGQIKHNTLKSLGEKLRQWKCSLKERYYDESKTAAQVIATTPVTVNQEQYADLVNYWYSTDGQRLSTANKNRRKAKNNPHTAGSKTYAQHAYTLEQTNKVGYSRTMLYEPTHLKADGTAVSDEAAEIMRKIRDLTESQQSPCESTLKGSINWSKDDIYSQAVGNKEHSGRIRGLGFGFSSKNCGLTSNSDARFRVVSDEERMREKDNYIHELEVKVHDQSEKLHDQAEKLDSTINELSTVKGVLDFLIKQSGFQFEDIVNGIGNQASVQPNQGSSRASHDIEATLGNRRTI